MGVLRPVSDEERVSNWVFYVTHRRREGQENHE